jgi:hypothetical protein
MNYAKATAAAIVAIVAAAACFVTATIVTRPAAPQAQVVSGHDSVNSAGTVTSTGIDDQGARDFWYVCTPAGWREIQTSVPVHVWSAGFAAPGLHALGQPSWIVGPFSPSDTFRSPWDAPPAKRCGTEG